MEEVCNRENLEAAWKRVRRNKGSPGVDGMTIDAAKDYLREQWPNIRSQLLEGTYQPLPVKRVEIPKPDGGVRKLGVPCVVDRLIQQALLQVLQKRWDPTFSEHSYGFRPGRSAHQAVAQAQRYIAEGYGIVVDLDLEKFFDRVNHDMLMARVASRVSDKRVLRLIRAFLNAGVMEGGLVRPVDEGTPQGGPLSPLLSNLVLDDLDKELSRRGHRFCRYADDCNIYVRSRRAGERVMASVTKFLTQCMVRPCVARGFVDLAVWSCINVSGLSLEHLYAPGHYGYQRAAISLAARPRSGHLGQQYSTAPGRPSSISSFTLADLGGITSGLLQSRSFVRSDAVPSPRTAGTSGRRAQGRSRLAVALPPSCPFPLPGKP